jgi:hypothetical protein
LEIYCCGGKYVVFVVTYKLRVKYKMGCRNGYSEGRNDRQMTPHGCLNFNSYIDVVLYSGWTDGQMDREIIPVWAG